MKKRFGVLISLLLFGILLYLPCSAADKRMDALADGSASIASTWYSIGYNSTTPYRFTISSIFSIPIDQNLIPATASTYNLGSTTHPWNEIWYTSLNSSAADGSRSMIFSSNTSYVPGVGENSLYFEGNVCKVSQNGAESTVQTVKVEKLAVFSFSGGGSDIADNTVIDSYNPTAATITGVVITASDSSACSAVVDIWAASYANFPATVTDTITASAKPTLSSALANKDTTLTGWTTAIAADSFLRANYDSGDCTGTVTVTIFGTR